MTTDVNINGTKYIMEIYLSIEGNSYLTLTEVCNHPSTDECDHTTYDFKELIG